MRVFMVLTWACVWLTAVFLLLSLGFLSIEEQAYWFQYLIVERGYFISAGLFFIAGLVYLGMFLQFWQRRSVK